MITYCPAYIIASNCGYGGCGERQPRDYLPLYGDLARQVLDWEMPYEVLIDTSAIHCSEFAKLPSQHATQTVLAKLFLEVGTDYPRGRFLHRLGIRKWADLSKPIRVEGRESKAWYPWREGWDVRERKLREQGPNECHPEAVYAQDCYFQFAWDRRWRFVLHYGYSYDGSSWEIETRQTTESLSTFVNVTVPKWLAATLEPESDEREREYRNCEHDRLTEAVEAVFSHDWYSAKGADENELVKAILDGTKPCLTRRRLAVLRRWMGEDAKAAARWVAKRKGGVS